LNIFLLLLLHKHRSFLLDEIGLRDSMWNFNMDGIRLLDLNRDLIRDRHFVRDFHRISHYLLNRVGDFLLDVYRITLDYFKGVRLLNLDFKWNLHWIKHFLFHCDRILLLDGDLHFLIDDDDFNLLVGATEIGVGIPLGGGVAPWPCG
jgi:hypothetical protein